MPIYTENLKSVGAVVAEESLESDTDTHTDRLRTNTQQYNVHLMIKMKVTLTDDECHRLMSKVIKNELMVISRKLLHSQTTYLEPRHNTISDI